MTTSLSFLYVTVLLVHIDSGDGDDKQGKKRQTRGIYILSLSFYFPLIMMYWRGTDRKFFHSII